MQDRYLFDSDDFEQNAPILARTLANVLRSRGRHGHLVRSVLTALEAAAAESDDSSLVPTAGSLMPPRVTGVRRSSKTGMQRREGGRARAICHLIDRLDEIGGEDRLDPKARMLRSNLRLLGEILGLDEIECDILYCRMICDFNHAYSRLVDKIHETLPGIHDSIACVLAVEPDAIRARLSQQGRLRRGGLIRLDPVSRDFSGAIDPLSKLAALGFEAFGTASALKEYLLGRPGNSELRPDDFEHLGDDLKLITKVLRGAFEARATGVNILLYGIPGTGKTEFAKMLSTTVCAPVFPIGEADSEGGEPSRGERLSELALLQMLLSMEPSPAFCCFDEAEDLFGALEPPLMRRTGSKVFMNRLFENNTVPVIWIVNDIEALPTTVRRRMTMALKVDQPPCAVSARIVTEMAEKRGMALHEAEVAALVKATPAAPGVFAKALQATDLATGDLATLRHVSTGLVEALHDGNAPASNRPAIADNFRPELSNADLDLVGFAQRLEAAAGKPFSLCLYGASGTGKSAFALHVAERLGMETRHLRGSDLLGMFVGQTEAAIARAFREAERDGLFLILDEIDALLHDRASAQRSFEVSQVNELLQAMESHPLPFACTTNLFDRVDAAALRRFTFRVRFRPLAPVQLSACYRHFFCSVAPAAVGALSGLVPSDFELVRKQAEILGVADDDGAIMRMLEAELAAKPDAPREVGFRPSRSPARGARDPVPAKSMAGASSRPTTERAWP